MPKTRTSEKNSVAAINKRASAEAGSTVRTSAVKSTKAKASVTAKPAAEREGGRTISAAVRAAKASIDRVREAKPSTGTSSAASGQKNIANPARPSGKKQRVKVPSRNRKQIAVSGDSDAHSAAVVVTHETPALKAAAEIRAVEGNSGGGEAVVETAVTLKFDAASTPVRSAAARLDFDEVTGEGSEETLATLIDVQEGPTANGQSERDSQPRAEGRSQHEQQSGERPLALFTVSAADVSLKVPEAHQALNEAIRRGDADAVRRMLEEDSGLARQSDAIVEAAGCGNVEIVRLLVDADADPNHMSQSEHHCRPLHRAIECAAEGISPPTAGGHLDVIRTLLFAGADVRARGSRHSVAPVALCAMLGQEQFVRDLLGYCDGWDIFMASSLGRSDVVWMILGRDRTAATAVEVNSMSALDYCAASRIGKNDAAKAARLASVAKLLIGVGAEVNGRLEADSADARTPLMWAVENEAVTEVLLANGATAATKPGAASRKQRARHFARRRNGSSRIAA